MKQFTISVTATEAVFEQLADAMNSIHNGESWQAKNDICSAVANLIAGAGTHGGTAQVRMMDLATKYGFKPEYWAGDIRVSWCKED